MRKPAASLCLLLAWLCANGALLDAVQVFAWSKMFASYAQTMSVSTALRETFDPAKPCEMCIGVAIAKETQKQLPVTADPGEEKRFVLALHAPAKFVLGQPPGRWTNPAARFACSWREQVPVPPPRA